MTSVDNFRDRALRWLPGGSNGEYGIPEGDAPVIDRGAGCRVWDTAGREYLDMTMAWGAALVGHAHPKVLEAANAAASNGANFAAVTRPMVELAERIADLSPCVDRIRFVASGTEGQVNAVEPAKGRSRCYVCGEARSKGIAVGELRFRYTVRSACGRFKSDKTTLHTACATARPRPSAARTRT